MRRQPSRLWQLPGAWKAVEVAHRHLRLQCVEKRCEDADAHRLSVSGARGLGWESVSTYPNRDSRERLW